MTDNSDTTTTESVAKDGLDASEEGEDGERGVRVEAAETAEQAEAWLADALARSRESDVGAAVGKALAWPLLFLTAQLGKTGFTFARMLGRLTGEGLWRNFIKAGYKGLLKSTKGADTIMHVMHKGQLIHEPVAWDNEEQHYRTHDKENWWNAPDESSHRYTAYSAVPTMFASSSANHVGDHVQAEVAEAMEFGDDRPVYTDATVQMVLDATSDAAGGQAGAAVADGGQVGVTDVSVSNPGALEDFVVPLGNPGDGDLGGRTVSGNKYYATYPETTDTEEMNRQEWRGREAERDMEQMMDRIQKIVLYAFIAVLGTVAVFVLGPKILASGGGGGGGGGIIPLMQTLPLGV